MNAPLGSYRAMAMEPPLDPPDVEEGLLSMQPLGDAQVMVEYALGGVYGLPCVVGAWIAGEFVEEHEFSTHRVERWTAAIMAELEKDKEDAQAAAWAERQERCE